MAAPARKQESKPSAKGATNAATPAAAVARLESVLQGIQQVISGVLGFAVEANQPLMEAGLDSLATVELRNALSSKFGVDLPTTVVFDHPTSAALAKHLAGSLSEAADRSHAMLQKQAWRLPEEVAQQVLDTVQTVASLQVRSKCLGSQTTV